uniref:Putative transcriptional repressor ctcf ixodes scapularis transcriptional repressor ctcf n=1 Tax=Amblyomma triste TaxID=251400 RepID=A0A023G7F7_AMBTT
MEDDEDEDMDDMGMEDGMVNEGQQVVVFEVIQIPAADGVTMEQHAIRAVSEDALRISSNGSVLTGADGQELTIIQQVPQDQAVVTEAVTKAALAPMKRPRGRPRKYATMEAAASNQGEEGMTKTEMDAPQREAEMARRRLEQKQKDMEECFGFNDEEDETILAMPAAPGVNGPSEEKVPDGTTTTYILMQENGDAV